MSDLTMKPVGLAIVIGAIVYAIFDLYCVVFNGVSSTISQFIVSTTHTDPVLAFCFGVVVGHLFCNMYPNK